MIAYEVNPDTCDGVWPRVQVNGKFIANEVGFYINDDGTILVKGIVLDWGINVKTHCRFGDILRSAIDGVPLKMRFIDNGGVHGDEHEVHVLDVDIQEADYEKIYSLKFIAI